jgi:hypothetical protein
VMVEVATERMFAEPSILDTIVSVASALRQYEGAGGLVPPGMLEGRGGSRGVRSRHGVGRGLVRAIADQRGHGRVPTPAR